MSTEHGKIFVVYGSLVGEIPSVNREASSRRRRRRRASHPGTTHPEERMRRNPREDHQPEPGCGLRPSQIYLPFAIQGQPLPEEQVFGGQGCPRPKAYPQEPPEIDPEHGHHPAKMKTGHRTNA